MDIKDIAKLVSILEGTEVTEFQFEQDGTSIRINRAKQIVAIEQPITVATTHSQTTSAATFQQTTVQPVAAVEDNTVGLTRVESPIVGTFYRKPAPDAQNFVEVGSQVTKGQRLCIIEAMKLMNEIEAPVSGVIEKILANDTSVVEFGELLFLIRPS